MPPPLPARPRYSRAGSRGASRSGFRERRELIAPLPCSVNLLLLLSLATTRVIVNGNAPSPGSRSGVGQTQALRGDGAESEARRGQSPPSPRGRTARDPKDTPGAGRRGRPQELPARAFPARGAPPAPGAAREGDPDPSGRGPGGARAGTHGVQRSLYSLAMVSMPPLRATPM